MNELLTAILDQKVAEVRALAASQPALLAERSASGLLPIEVASSSGYVQITVALLRQNAPGSERITHYTALLIGYLQHLSHTHACAGWLVDIEFMVWCVVVGDTLPIEDAFGFGNLTRDELMDLRFLSERSQAWPYYDGTAGVVELDDWQKLYRQWYENYTRPTA